MPDLPRLFVHGPVLVNFERLRPRPWEIGGWLLGWWGDDERSLFVTHATPPASRGTPLGVKISGRGHRHLFDSAWDASGGIVTFLGDWHTHPGSVMEPSKRDRRAMEQLASDSDYGTPLPLVGIVGTPRWSWQHRSNDARFYLRTGDGEIAELSPAVADALPAAAADILTGVWGP